MKRVVYELEVLGIWVEYDATDKVFVLHYSDSSGLGEFVLALKDRATVVEEVVKLILNPAQYYSLDEAPELEKAFSLMNEDSRYVAEQFLTLTVESTIASAVWLIYTGEA